MMEQPDFGRRLRELRRERGLSQAALAGEEISTGYLSRLESGARQPTDRVVTYLAGRLGADRTVFDAPSSGGSLTRALSIVTSSEGEAAIESLVTALAASADEKPLPRWQALWLVARHWRGRGERAKEQPCLEELVQIADELELPELQCRSRAQLARCLRTAGEASRAIDIATGAYRLAKDAGLAAADTGRALLTLVSAETEAGRLPDASSRVDELVALVSNDDAHGALRTEALWSAATVRSRQGDHPAARDFLERAMQGLHIETDLTLWVRLRLAATSLYLQAEPPLLDRGRACLAQAEQAVALVGTPVLRQEMLLLRGCLALLEGRTGDARTAHTELTREEVLLDHRDQIRMSALDSQLLILEGHRDQGLNQLKKLGEQARQAANIDLAAYVWRVLAQALEAVLPAASDPA
ncbi:helix-turn-helix domain-containing protein [Streptomyces odontomachi]|uniref:helix-turn-helix domain-containing protein n=1 Tax=Streptomyces odontomachi TaxID=2944940 RepID=UPI00210EA534|nr:helix-turn-helix domain-containing protein [Streptomyces sp. ODS25]